MASKRRTPLPDFPADIQRLEGLLRECGPADNREFQQEEELWEHFSEPRDARDLARWFSLASEVMGSPRLPDDERAYLSSIVHALLPQRYDASLTRLRVMGIANRTATHIREEEAGHAGAFSPRDRFNMHLAFFRVNHKAAAGLDPEALWQAAIHWHDRAGKKKGQPRGKLPSDQHKGKFSWVSRSIEGTPLRCSAAALRKLWERR